MPSEDHWLVKTWNWLGANDIPNWIVLLFTAIVWPVALLVWNRRTVNNIPHLEVVFTPGNITIGETPHSAIGIDIINHTGSVVYIRGARIKRCSSLFPVPSDAARDIAEDSYHLKFLQPNGGFVDREVTLQTNHTARTTIATTARLPQAFYSYKAPWYRRAFRLRKYFVLEYTAMVGTTRRAVVTLY
ncbi:MAG: hypothetical protein ACT4P8_21715 [Betaproteobacteria bacterium]